MSKANSISISIQKEIQELTTYTTEIGLTVSINNQTIKQVKKSVNIPGEKTNGHQKTIDYIAPSVQNEDHKIIFNDELEYKELYKHLDEQMNYNMKLLDGALISLVYEIQQGRRNGILTHRLSFFPSPYLYANEISSDDVSQEELYSDIISKNIYPFPIRFDFDLCNRVDLVHPTSHLTLGQYKNCRIPVTSAVTPGQFIEFILRNFYYKYYDKYKDEFSRICKMCEINESITESEKGISHFVIK